MNKCPEPLINCVIDDTLLQTMPDLCQAVLQFIDVMNLRAADVSMHASIPKYDILALNVTQQVSLFG